jgi:hypothetical protein
MKRQLVAQERVASNFKETAHAANPTVSNYRVGIAQGTVNWRKPKGVVVDGKEENSARKTFVERTCSAWQLGWLVHLSQPISKTDQLTSFTTPLTSSPRLLCVPSTEE